MKSDERIANIQADKKIIDFVTRNPNRNLSGESFSHSILALALSKVPVGYYPVINSQINWPAGVVQAYGSFIMYGTYNIVG